MLPGGTYAVNRARVSLLAHGDQVCSRSNKLASRVNSDGAKWGKVMLEIGPNSKLSHHLYQ